MYYTLLIFIILFIIWYLLNSYDFFQEEETYSKQLLLLEGKFPERDIFNDQYLFHEYIKKYYHKTRLKPIIKYATKIDDFDIEKLLYKNKKDYNICSTHLKYGSFYLYNLDQINELKDWSSNVMSSSIKDNPLINILLKWNFISPKLNILNIKPRLYIEPVHNIWKIRFHTILGKIVFVERMEPRYTLMTKEWNTLFLYKIGEHGGTKRWNRPEYYTELVENIEDISSNCIHLCITVNIIDHIPYISHAETIPNYGISRIFPDSFNKYLSDRIKNALENYE